MYHTEGQPEEAPPSYESNTTEGGDSKVSTNILTDDTRTQIHHFFQLGLDAWNRKDMHQLVFGYSEDCIYEDGRGDGRIIRGRDNLRKDLLRRQHDEKWNMIDWNVKQTSCHIFMNDQGEVCVSTTSRVDYEIKSSEKCTLCILCCINKDSSGWLESSTEYKLRIDKLSSTPIQIYESRRSVIAEKRI